MKFFNRKIFESFDQHVESTKDYHKGDGDLTGINEIEMWGTFFKFLTIMKPYWDKLVLIVLLVCCTTITRLLWPWMGKMIVDDAIPNKDWTLFWILVAANIGLMLFNKLFWFLNQLFIKYIDLWVLADLKSRFFEHQVRLSMSYLESKQVGEHVYRANADVWSVMFLVTDLLPRLLEAIFEFFLLLLLLSYLDWRVTVLVALTMIPWTIILHIVTTFIRKFDREARAKWQNVDAILQDGVAGKTVVKTFARRRWEVYKYMCANIDSYRVEIKKRYTNILKGQLIGNWGLLPWLMGWGVRAWFFKEVVLGHMTYGSLLPIFNYMNRFRNPIQHIIYLIQRLRVCMVPAERLSQTINLSPKVLNKPKAKNIPEIKGEVEFNRVDFGYEKGVPILNKLDFKIEPGKKIAFVGHSGAGKSTVLKMLLRLYDPQSGEVKIDGHDVRDVRMESIQQQVGLVLQNTYLFIGTIRDNLLFSNPQATDEVIWNALELSDLADFVRALPDGLDTDMHEGTSLSGGQKQRLGIARAMVRDPKLFLLDEPTSSLDSETEAHVQATLRKAREGRTTILISHRMPTVIDSDIIHLMDAGKIVESGTHEELMAKRGGYYDLYTLYFKGITKEENTEKNNENN